MKRLLLGWVAVFLIGFAFLAGPWLLIYIGLLFSEDPPKPAYTYGEFPFYLEYEIDGQVKIVEDTVIVEYDGFRLSEGTGKYIKWKQTLASGNKQAYLYNRDGESTKIYFSILEKNYHLDDENKKNDYNSLPNTIRKQKIGSRISISGITDRELIDEYSIKLIKFEFGEPLRR